MLWWVCGLGAYQWYVSLTSPPPLREEYKALLNSYREGGGGEGGECPPYNKPLPNVSALPDGTDSFLHWLALW